MCTTTACTSPPINSMSRSATQDGPSCFRAVCPTWRRRITGSAAPVVALGADAIAYDALGLEEPGGQTGLELPLGRRSASRSRIMESFSIFLHSNSQEPE